VSFSAGDWSAGSLAAATEDFAAIGRALGEHGGLRLWSCHAGAGAAGAALVEGLEAATGAKIASAHGLVGAAALGGCWALEGGSQRSVRPPLSDAGIAAYAGVLPTFTIAAGATSSTGVDTWAHAASWTIPTGVVPSATTPGSLTFVSNHDASSTAVLGLNTIYMPPTLRQATGTGTTWTISDTGNASQQFTTSLTLDNQGQVFVNSTNNFTPGAAATAWILNGQTLTARDNQFFQNDGAVNIIGASAGSTTASLAGTLSVTGSGQWNLFGNNATLTVGSGVGVSSGQTFNFENTGTAEAIFETTALNDSATFAGFITGDTVTLQNLIGSAIAPTSSVTLGNGQAIVSILNGGTVVDESLSSAILPARPILS
jgi:hypothetical protein